jgi:4-azaleucine resistance transporter AzlC
VNKLKYTLVEEKELILTKWKESAKDAIPIIIGYLPIGTAYGVIARQAGLSFFESILMSVLVFAGASQFIGVGLLAAGAGFIEVVVTTFFINLRHILMSASLAPYLKKARSSLLPILAFGVTDETYAVSITRFREEKANQWYMLGVNFIAYFSWVGGSLIGALIGAGIPPYLQDSFAFALPALFIGLLILQIEGKLEIAVLIVAAVASSLFYFRVEGVWNVIFATIVGATVGVMLEKWMGE